MSLASQPEVLNATATTSLPNFPAFEAEDATPIAEVLQAAPAPAAHADIAASSAVVQAQIQTKPVVVQSSLPNAEKFSLALQDKKDMFGTDVVNALSLSIPRIKGEQGAGMVGDKSFGSKFRIAVESWNMRWLVSPGLNSTDPGYKESMEYLRNSYDKVSFPDDGRSVAEYLSFLKEDMGYHKASVNEYADIWCFVTWTEKEGDISPEKQTLHLLQASKTSVGKFVGFCTTQGLLAKRGIVTNLEEIEVHAEVHSKGTLKYTNFNFAAAPKKV